MSSSGCSCAPAGPVYTIPCPSAKCSPCYLPAVAVPVPIPGPQGPPGPPGQDDIWIWATDASNGQAMLVPQPYPLADPERDQLSELVFPFTPGYTTNTGNAQTRFIFDAFKAAIRAGRVSNSEFQSSLRGDYSAAFGMDNLATNVGSGALSGLGNTSAGDNSVITGGTLNRIQTDGGFVGGGVSNAIGVSGTGSNAVIVGGSANSVQADFSGILGGQGNGVTDVYSGIGGGASNTVASKYSTIGGGQGNAILVTSTGFGVIGGGTGNTVSANYATIGGGQGGSVSGVHGHIGGGLNNRATTQATVAGGVSNTASGSAAFVGGGSGNAASGGTATVGGGGGNTASGASAFVGGGSSNVASGSTAAVLGGSGNNAAGTSSFAAGTGNTVSSGSTAAFALGQSNNVQANSANSIAVGAFNVVNAGGTMSQTAIPSGAVGGSNDIRGRNVWSFGVLNTADVTTLGVALVGHSNAVINQSGGIVVGTTNVVGTTSQSTATSTVMGVSNTVQAGDQTVVYGRSNTVASGSAATAPIGVIALGASNILRADAGVAVGINNSVLVGATGGVAVGSGATVAHAGSMVLSAGQAVASTSSNSLTAAFTGGYTLWTDPTLTVAAYLPAGQSAWSYLCDAAAKDLEGPVDTAVGLRGVRRLPVHRFRYKAGGGGVTHMGPTAGDFHAAFSGVRPDRDPGRIDTLEFDSALLLAVQELDKRLRALRRKRPRSSRAPKGTKRSKAGPVAAEGKLPA